VKCGIFDVLGAGFLGRTGAGYWMKNLEFFGWDGVLLKFGAEMGVAVYL